MNPALLVFALLLQRPVPDATLAERALAQLDISVDGKTVTVRPAAPDDLRLCVAPKAGVFGPMRCFEVGKIRRGEVRER